MAKSSNYTEIPAGEENTHAEQGFFAPDVTMVLLTWVTFFLLLGILYKFAWKPILAALEIRENTIRKSLEDVEHIKVEMARLDEKCAKIVSGAEQKASDIIGRSQRVAKDTATIIEDKAREEAKILLENALRDIGEETQKAQMILREESAQLAVDLAGKLIEENMTTKKNQTLINKFIKNI